MKMLDYIIIIEKGDGNNSAYCPDLPGVAAAAETEDETIDLIRDAIELHLEGLKDENSGLCNQNSRP
ncbi:MAG: type II toxin-antitoxin system HicB family antitoxin [Methanothrix sp.]|jgi:predicted RNase H-like HicB family nuclease|nr:type II toxin-antitoxin system HicB family antitoxin [Methanothrix sp.]